MIRALFEKSRHEGTFPLRQGVFVAVAGPSGSGKDSVLAYARSRLGRLERDIVFARRVITRPSDPGDEEHDTVSKAKFERLEAAGSFALAWRANGLCYGLPAVLDEEMRQNRVVVANVSRAVIEEIGKRYANVIPVIISAPREVLAARLASRGRETRRAVLARLARGSTNELAVAGALEIDNSGPLEIAGDRFLELLRRAAARSDVCDTL
ncbi:phosphonate metabolism protein/1,5-bisphosphokinase (PRPP-forming) PhnN [Chelativorans sp. Marseille-P2723]|uniref:phosphonate metabolism protein/1,5-bisphosphokinase (PRPP-forming) PhnN n=1 Tax=Chelativorans sp. Marseille-P2723 TaxID=2709133 RepID=UPI00156D6B04|nr:phosphonate metabolism protein/1,5-bisphosphokinase (PRPP-forming) PhnN [Chelativorans sp. Marseille-P2723]